MLIHREHDKARRYLDSLDVARCSGNWEAVPELVRKIEKHAPQRKCLALTAQSECRIASQSHKHLRTSSSLAVTGLPQLIPSLLTAADNEKTFHEDAFQARVCLGWLHWIINEPGLAVSRLPNPQASNRLMQDAGALGGWTNVCIVKGAFIRGNSQETAGSSQDALQTYESMLPYVSDSRPPFSSSPEHRFWTSQILARHCILCSLHMKADVARTKEMSSAAIILAPFRAWAGFWETGPGQDMGRLDGAGQQGTVSRRRVWQAYYEVLSMLLQHGSPYPPWIETSQIAGRPSSGYGNKSSDNIRPMMSTELKKVEAIYEGLLLKEVKFPKANEASPEIENWVAQVMTNWRVLCGGNWQDEDFGEGGKEAAGKDTLAILYRAATRSFHSTRILRQLFTVHTSLSDFELAGKALDSYLEIVVKGKARVEKSGEDEPSLDDDTTALCTAAAGVQMLCMYGLRREAERAQDIAIIIEKWLNKIVRASSPEIGAHAVSVSDQQSMTSMLVTDKAKAVAFRALGISQAHWARQTYETSSRSELQAKAINNLRTALKPELGDEQNVETLYILAYLLAETREIDAAITIVKTALSIGSDTAEDRWLSSDGETFDNKTESDETLDFGVYRLLLKCWHLLALLLSARQEYSLASASCEAALEQYGGLSVLLGDSKNGGIVEKLESTERQSIVEIKMTQLAISEVVDGPEEAVNASDELLGLYAKLVGLSEKQPAHDTIPEPVLLPPSRNGTMNSIRGSILGRSKVIGSSIQEPQAGDTRPSSIRPPESQTEFTRTPTISITADDSAVSCDGTHHSHPIIHHESKKLRKRNSKKSIGSIRKSRAASPVRIGTASESQQSKEGIQWRTRNASDGPTDSPLNDGVSYAADEVGVAVSHDMPPPPTPISTGLNGSSPATHLMSSKPSNQNQPNRDLISSYLRPPKQIPRTLPPSPQFLSSLPQPRFSSPEQQRHALTLLVKVWLLIAGLYRRASMYTDAQGAISEARKHVQGIETAVASLHSSAEAFSIRGYAGLKSVDELWADVHADQAFLHLALSAKENASNSFETALLHFPDHLAATVGLSNLLLDFYAQTPITTDSSPEIPETETDNPSSTPILTPLPFTAPRPTQDPTDPTLLSRLAARDRAYLLLSSLTKSGQGWDLSEAWIALARAYEEGGQVERAKEALWWVVELEGGRPVRGWGCVGAW